MRASKKDSDSVTPQCPRCGERDKVIAYRIGITLTPDHLAGCGCDSCRAYRRNTADGVDQHWCERCKAFTSSPVLNPSRPTPEDIGPPLTKPRKRRLRKSSTPRLVGAMPDGGPAT